MHVIVCKLYFKEVDIFKNSTGDWIKKVEGLAKKHIRIPHGHGQ